MIEYYTNESAAHLLLSMTRIVEKPEDCEALRKCLNQAVENAVREKDNEIYRLRMYQNKLKKRIVFLSKTLLEAHGNGAGSDAENAVFLPTPDE